ncbi:MAG: CpaF family protein, partial [Acidobacteriota bacterium]
MPSLPVDNSALNDLKARIHRRLINRVDLEKLGKLEADIAREEVRKVLATLLDEENVPINGSERESITTDVLNEIFGLGPLEPLLADKTISDILVNGARSVYI